MNKIAFKCLIAKQSRETKVISFVANPEQISKISRVSRVGRTETQELFGFQRSQISNHINEIHDYLEEDNAVLPNSIILAFTNGINLKPSKSGNDGIVEISVESPEVGLIVDGQQRFTALSMLENKDFEIFVSAIICQNEEELQKQFILINNTRPLPKDLIYELLPTVEGIPVRLSSRSFASNLTQKLNFLSNGSLEGLIKVHTNPTGVIASTSMHKVIMNSKSDGALRYIFKTEGQEGCLSFIDNFFSAVRVVFEEDWYRKDGKGRNIVVHTPRTSRLIHGAGIIALGHIMDTAFAIKSSKTKGEFIDVLEIIKPYTAWTSGTWDFKPTPKHWSEIQNIAGDIRQLREFLFHSLLNGLKQKEKESALS